MLSRMLSARGARSLVSQSTRSLAMPMLSRNFMTSSALRNALPVATKTEEALDPADIIDKYGTTTFWATLAAILVSKEMFILDAEFMLACEVGAFVLTGYVLTGDTLTKMSAEQDKATTTKFEAANDFMIEMFTQYKMVNATVQNKPAVMKQYAEEYQTAIEAFAAYETVKPRHLARASMLTALESIKGKEEHAASAAWQETVNAAVHNVSLAFADPNSALNTQMLELSIKNLGFSNVDTSESEDPVKRMFMEQFPDDEEA